MRRLLSRARSASATSLPPRKTSRAIDAARAPPETPRDRGASTRLVIPSKTAATPSSASQRSSLAAPEPGSATISKRTLLLELHHRQVVVPGRACEHRVQE